jgi:hypothetical protein
MNIENLKPGTKVKVIKDLYYLPEDTISECEYFTKEELFFNFAQLLVVDDIWEYLGKEDGIDNWECISGTWKGECNEGWWDLENIAEKGCFEVIE